MSIERKIYPGYAFSENELEKRDMNRAIYEELCEKYKIARGTTYYDTEQERMMPINKTDFDVIVECVRHGCGNNVYSVVKNGPELTDDQLALICDGGSICFNYAKEGSSLIRIFTD